jgi:hypothetical protein
MNRGVKSEGFGLGVDRRAQSHTSTMRACRRKCSPRPKRTIVCAVLLGLCVLGCAAQASKRDPLRERLGIQGSIEGRTYKAPGRAFKVAVHPQAQPWLDKRRPTRPADARIPGDRWLVDGRRSSSDGSSIAYVTFWEAGEPLDRWDGYDNHTLEVRRLRSATDAVDLGVLIDEVVADHTARYKEAFGARVRSERISRGDLESGDLRYTYAAYDYEIKATVIPNTLSRTYQAYTNVCAFRPQPDVVVVATSEVVAAGRDINEKERRQRVARNGCDLAWLGTLKFPEPTSSTAQ